MPRCTTPPPPPLDSQETPDTPAPLLSLALIVALLAADAACSRAPETATAHPSAGDWLVYGDTVEPSTLNCARASERAAVQVCRLVADSLIDFDQSQRFVPRLAESYEVSDDGRVITFRLRAGVRWHDGKPFSAADVLHTVDLLGRLDGGRRHRVNFGPLEKVESPDDRTIRATYKEVFAGALVGWRETFIVPAHVPIPDEGASPMDRAPVGTGPFVFQKWEPQQQIILQANTAYHAGRPWLDRYVQRIVPSAETLRAAALTGEVDVAPMGADWIAQHPDDGKLPFRAHVLPTRVMQVIYWNADSPGGAFRDARVRRAMTLLLDRPGYAGRVQHGVYRVAATLVDVWGGDPALAPLPYDPNAAMRLLDEAGFRDRDGDGVREGPRGPLAFTLIYPTISPDHRAIAHMLERSAASAGVKVTLQGLEWAVMRPKVYAREFDAAVFQWSLEPLPDPYAYFHSSQIQPGSGTNFGGYRSAAFDALADQSRRTLDPDRSADLVRRMQAILHEDQPCTVVAVAGSVVAVARRFRHPDLGQAGLWNWYPGLLGWWVPPGERKHR
jgi:peptide/nickel transport system substrate-binding protein